MKRHSVSVVLVALVLLAGCGGAKRKPAVLTDPAARPSAGAYPPPPPLRSRSSRSRRDPDTTAIPSRWSRAAEDFTPNDASGENGPLEDIRFDYDRAELSDAARATLEKHGSGCRTIARRS
jgi:hypothetical protein